MSSNPLLDKFNKIKNGPIYTAESISHELAMTIENKLDLLNKKHNYFAKELHVSKSYVSQILQGQSNMTIQTICKIAHALDMSPSISIKNKGDTFIYHSHGDIIDTENYHINTEDENKKILPFTPAVAV